MKIDTDISKKHKTNIFVLCFLSFLCFIPVFATTVNLFSLEMTPYIIAGLIALTFILFVLPFLLFKARTAFLINTTYILLAPLELFSLYYYQSSLRSGPILLILQTNFQEAVEFLSSYKLLIVIYFVVLIVYLFFVIRFIKNEYLLLRKRRIILLLCSIIAFLGLYAYCIKVAYNPEQTSSKIIKKTNKIYKLKFKKIYPVNVYIAFKEAYQTLNRYKLQNSAIENFSFYAVPKRSVNEKEIYVFVIGETARYANFSINGYHRETTPLLLQTNNIISFSDVFTEANSTGFSLPILLSRSTAQNFTIHSKEKTVVDAFNEAGFSTYWIGNQSYGDSFIQSIASRTTDSYFTIKEYDDVNSFDEILWEYLDKVLNKNEQKQFIVIHTLGSHFRYNLRHPDTFRIFQPDLTGLMDYALINKNLKKELVNSYDNSIVYTDYFLTKTIEKINKKGAVSYVLYISDHGENLYDDESNIGFHATAQPSINELHVPLIIWNSDKYSTCFPEKSDAIRNNKDKKLTSNSVFYSLLDMGNIDIKGNNLSKSIANSTLEEDSIRYVINPNNEILSY